MLVSTAITYAFRDANLIPAGQTPNANEQQECVDHLNTFWPWLQGYVLGDNYIDWYIPPPTNAPNPPTNLVAPLTDDSILGISGMSSWWLYPVVNTRLIVNATTSMSIVLPQFPDPGARIQFRNAGSLAPTITLLATGNGAPGRFIEGNPSLTLPPTQLDGLSWFWRDDLDSWQRIVPINLTDAAFPLPAQYDDLWISWLALRILPRNASPADPLVLENYKMNLAVVKAKYQQEVPTAISDSRLSQGAHSYRPAGIWW